MLSLIAVAQQYAWGRNGGDECTVAEMHALNADAQIDQAKPYAELWIGTHPSGPTKIKRSDGSLVLLADWLKENPKALGDEVASKWDSTLPYLFKILSVRTALSIQAHPDKTLAEQLHQERPNVYKDDNHKPEMALAITPFEAMCGFENGPELKKALTSVPELAHLVGEENVEALCRDDPSKDDLKNAFTALMTAKDEDVKTQLSAMVTRLKEESTKKSLSRKESLALRLEEQYPDDIGVFACFFLNYIELEVGEGIFLAANEPHAYVSGEIIEAMATSDNVVRAGLTPKLRDTDVLCNMLTYSQGEPTRMNGDAVDDYTKRYSPPMEEFQVDKTELPASTSYEFPTLKCGSALIVLQGSAALTCSDEYPESIKSINAAKGQILFLAANAKLAATTTTSDFVTYRCSVSDRFFL